jgi:hypothetical protein
VRQISDTLRQIFDEADAMGTTPLAAAMAIAGKRLEKKKPQRRSAGRSTPAGSRPSSASLSR